MFPEVRTIPCPPGPSGRLPACWPAGIPFAAYAIAESVNAYREALRLCDSTLSGPYQDSLLLGQNALSMMEYCSQPVVVARQRFSRKDFFLYYPLKDRAWRPCPNPLDSLGRGAMYIDPDARTLYYSAMDEDGIRNLYRTRDLDSLWSVPELINEQMTSQSVGNPSISPPADCTGWAATTCMYRIGTRKRTIGMCP